VSEAPAPNPSCFHCGLPIPPGSDFHQQIEGQTRDFCCIGCQSVCKAIYDAGMQGFYRRTPEGTPLGPPPEPPRDTALYDLDAVQEEFVSTQGEGREIHLLVEGIHCAACVWLIEHALAQLPGILSAQVNLSNKRMLLRWDPEQIKLSHVIQRLGEIGYAATPFDPEAAEGVIRRQNRALLLRLAFAGFAAMNLMWISIALYTGADEGEYRGLFHWMGLVLATPTLLYSGWPFLKGAWSGIRNRHPGMDLPIAIGAVATYSYSTYVTLAVIPGGHVYFDTVVNFLFVILIGRHLEGMSKRHAVAASQRLLDLQPRVATRLNPDGSEEVVPIRAVRPGDLLVIRPGAQIPADGVIREGSGLVDESMLSGESRPVNKTPGDALSAGTLNNEGAMTMEVTGTLKHTALGRIIRLVEEAQASKAPIQCAADRVVPWFVSATLGLAALTFLLWLQRDFELALMAATSVLIITCPCAFGLATPMAIAVASGQGARHGILVKNGAVLETLSQIRHFVFDKTGTLTEGRMGVRTVVGSGISEQDLLRLAAAAERLSEHSIARAILREAELREIAHQQLVVADFMNRAGFGVSAKVSGTPVQLGTTAWLEDQGIAVDPALERRAAELEEDAISSIHVAIAGSHAGLIGLADRLRPDAPALVRELRDQGIEITLLSGDRRKVAEAIARQLGGMQVIAEVLPDQKDEAIRRLQAGGATVAMVGDGINDAPALIRADVGIALGSGTDVSLESADIVLMSEELSRISLASQLSRRTLRTVRQNIGLSIAYNVVMIPLAMLGMITPLLAAIAMPLSSLAVIGNAARIRSLFKQD